MSQIKDFSWYAPHVLRIQTKTEGLKPFALMEYQRRYVDHLKKDFHDGIVRSIVLKARQCGFSTLVGGINTHRLVTEFNYKVMVLADKSSRTDDVVNIYKRFIANIPQKIKPMMDRDNEREISFDNPNPEKRVTNPGLGSSLKAETALDPYVGRSGTRKAAHLTEAAFYRYSSDIDEGIGNSIPLAKGTFIVRESTANGRSGLGEAFYNLWQAAEKGETIYKPFFVPWYQVDNYSLSLPTDFRVSKEEKELLKICPTVTKENLVWRRMKLLEYAVSTNIFTPEERFMQDFPSYPEEAFRHSGRPVFEQDRLQSDINRLRSEPPQKKNVTLKQPTLSMFPGLLTVFDVPQRGKKYTIGCLPDGEVVLTDHGWEKIQLVTFKDKLIDKNGKCVSIKNIQRRPFVGETVNIKPYFTSKETRFTGEHPILVLKDSKMHRRTSGDKKRYYNTEVEYKKASEITQKDILRFPIRYKEELSNKEILKKIPSQKNIRIDRRVNREIILEKDFWYFMGFWLAEGWIRKGGNSKLKTIEVCFNTKKEQDVAERIEKIIQRLFCRKACRTIRKSNSTELKFSSEVIYSFIFQCFGQKAEHKQIAEWIKYLPTDLKLSLFDGYCDGDGCFVVNGSHSKIACVSISEKLLHDFQDILLSCGIMPSVSVLREAKTATFRGRSYPTKKTYQMTIPARDSDLFFSKVNKKEQTSFKRAKHMAYGWMDDEFIYVKIHKISRSDFDGFVNNFETETHSYCSPFITTHNCDVAEGLESGDSSSCFIMDTDHKQVAIFHGKIDPDLFGKVLVELAKVYNNALIVPEINNMGYATLSAIKNEGYLRVYMRSTYEQIEDEKETDKLGWRTTAQSKMLMLSNLVALYREGNIQILDINLLREMLSLTRESNGDVVLGGQDRTVACCLACMGLNQIYESAKVVDPNKKERIQYETKDLYREKQHKKLFPQNSRDGSF